MKGSNAHTIEQRIVAWKRGRIFFPSDFADIASDGSVRITLMRLSKEGMIVRLASGIYYYPEMAHLQSSVFKLSKDLIDSIHEEGIVAYTS